MPVSTSLVGKSVVDPEGVELGFVAHADDRFLTVGESGTSLRLGRRFVGSIAERVLLRSPMYELFGELNVIDRDGEFVGVVKDTIDAEDVLDSLVVEDEDGQLMTVPVEDIRSIDEFVELSALGDEVREREGEGS